MNKKILGVLLCSGSGSRFSDCEQEGDLRPKQYKILDNKYLFQYSLDIFLDLKESNLIDEILVVIREQDHDFFQKILDDFYRLQKSQINVCFGGLTRTESVLNATKFARQSLKEFGYIMTHDSARPFASFGLFEGLIKKIVDSSGGIDCAFPALKINDAVRLIKDDCFCTVDRNNLYTVQTPQIFDFRKLELCFKFESEEGGFSNLNFFDEITLFEKYRGKIDFIKGERDNIKITFRDDLDQK